MIEEFSLIGETMLVSGLIGTHGGSMSVRRGNNLLITREGAMLSALKGDDVIEVPLESGGDDGGASRELVVHRAIYKNHKANAVIQAFPPEAIAISISDSKLVPQDAVGQSLFRGVPVVRAGRAIASDDVARILPGLVSGTNGVALVKGYCSFAFGKDLNEACKLSSALEISSKVLIASRSTSGGRERPQRPQQQHQGRRSAIPPGIGVMDRSRNRRRR